MAMEEQNVLCSKQFYKYKCLSLWYLILHANGELYNCDFVSELKRPEICLSALQNCIPNT